MCRHLAYVGPPVSVRGLLYEPPHALERQAYAATLCHHGPLNADGFGVAWYRPDGDPVRYRRSLPMWADASFAEVASVVTAECLVAAVRSASVGFPVEESGAQPFRAGHRLFSHNGRIVGFPAVEAELRRRAAAALGDDPAAVPDARAPLDSAPLLALAAGHWRAGAGLGDGLAEVVAEVTALAGGPDDTGTRLNLLAADGTALAATAYGDSLFVRDDRADGGAAALASEPYDDAPSWRRVPDRSLVQVGPSGVLITPLEGNRACRSSRSIAI